jgi:hypothetical protein
MTPTRTLRFYPRQWIRICYFFALPDLDPNSGSDTDPPFVCQQQRCLNFFWNMYRKLFLTQFMYYRSFEPVLGIERG